MTNEELRAMYHHRYVGTRRLGSPMHIIYEFDVETGDEPEEGVEFVVEVTSEHERACAAVAEGTDAMAAAWAAEDHAAADLEEDLRMSRRSRGLVRHE